MGCTAPILGRHVKAETGNFVAVADIVEIAANGQIAVTADADKTLYELFDIAALPVIELRRGDFTERYRAQAIRAAGFEHARRAQIGGNDLGDLATQCCTIARSGVGWRWCDERRNRNRASFGGIEFDQLGLVGGGWRRGLRLCR